MQVLYGSHTGTIDQDADFIYNDENDNIATVIGTNVSDIGLQGYNKFCAKLLLCNGSR